VSRIEPRRDPDLVGRHWIQRELSSVPARRSQVRQPGCHPV